MAMSEKTPEFPHDKLWEALSPAPMFEKDWILFQHGDSTRFLHGLVRRSPFPIELSSAGLSDEGCALHTLRFGEGERRVLIWARQHGDEPDCTAALCAALNFLVTNSEEPWVQFLLSELDIVVFPMVNPDGVARYTRQNAQGIDLNRDAVALSGPEAQALITLKHGFDPEYCFNLHDMYGRKSANDRDLVALAFQAGPFEERDIDNEVRLKAKTICGLMANEARRHAPDNLARYTADYMPKAFGDSMMRWGVSSILIEAGGWFERDGGDDFVRRLFALSLFRGLHTIAAGEDAEPTGTDYDKIPFDSGQKFADRILAGLHLLNGQGRPPFRADIAINHDPVIKRGARTVWERGSIVNIGDLELSLAKEKYELEEMLALPGFVVASPGVTFEGPLPTHEEALPYLEAGITTLACGFGPFKQPGDRDNWLAEARDTPPPINLIAFERVNTLDEIRDRHGLTRLAGMLLAGVQILPEDLLELAHLYHPAHHSALDEKTLDSAIGVELFFQMGASPRQTRLYLQLSLENVDVRARRFLPAGELIRFCKEFLDSPNQLTFGIDPIEPMPTQLPLLVSCGGLSNGRLPTPQFLSRALDHHQSRDESRLVNGVNLLLLRGIAPFVHGKVSGLALEARADMVVYPPEALLQSPRENPPAPSIVFLNGRVAFSRHDALAVESSHGSLILAPPHFDA